MMLDKEPFLEETVQAYHPRYAFFSSFGKNGMAVRSSKERIHTPFSNNKGLLLS